jgi:hypothetical protein
VKPFLALSLGTLLLACTGCMDRRIYITSEPSGAQVYLNDVEVGRTPAEVNFTYFGTYDVRLRKQGYEPLITSAKTDAPIHEWPGFDLVAMAWPKRTETVIRWHFTMQPSDTDEDALLERARGFQRDYGPRAAPTEGQGDQSSATDG